VAPQGIDPSELEAVQRPDVTLEEVRARGAGAGAG
jgi:hypothetical protein